jgi:predicted TPR repeat methyltransferase
MTIDSNHARSSTSADSAPTDADEAAPAATAEPVKELDLADALKLAVEMHQGRQYEGAETLYRRILALVPDHADTLNLLGMLRHQRGFGDEGVALIEQAIALVPGFAGFHNNLGNIHVSNGNVAAATAAYERAIELSPDSADLHNNLGALYRAEERFALARAQYEHAITLDPRHLNAHNNLGLLHSAEGDLPGAVSYYVKALELMPTHANGRRLLGTTYYSMGKIEEAAEVYRQWLAAEPDNPVARHMVASCSGVEVPSRAADDFVETTFDGFAESFETVLNERLHYQAPQLCAAMLARHLPAPERQFTMLDAGCGTGLCGPLIAPWARTLGGVDLSRGMLDRAKAKGVYADLYKAELTEFLNQSGGHWDVLLSADTLCYFGDLGPLMRAAHAALRPAGTLVFTVEALADGDDTPPFRHGDDTPPFRLEPHGRYAHARQHLEAVLRAPGFEVLEISAAVLRNEGGKPVNGWVVGARR